jgi:hypothetical protein
MKILKLRQMNEKLVKELKFLSTTLDKSLEKARAKQKGPNPYTDLNLKGMLAGDGHSTGEGARAGAEANQELPEGDREFEGAARRQNRLRQVRLECDAAGSWTSKTSSRLKR